MGIIALNDKKFNTQLEKSFLVLYLPISAAVI